MKDRDRILDEMIAWWTHRTQVNRPKGRIHFDRSSTVQASVRISTKMYNDAMAIAVKDPNLKNFSRFVEMLIWERLGQDSEYLKKAGASEEEVEIEV